MKYGMFALALMVSACADDEEAEEVLPDVPVDMQFRVKITQAENTCDDAEYYKPKDDERPIMDVFLLTNGKLNVSFPSARLPGPSLYKDVVLKNGRTDHKQKGSTYGAATFDNALKGKITPKAVDVEITVNDKKYGSGPACVRRFKLTGEARPLFDPNALDGNYAVSLHDHGVTCPGLPGKEQSPFNAHLDVDQHAPDKASLLLAGKLAFGPTAPDKDGALDWKGSLIFDHFFELEGTAQGRFRPSDVNFAIDMAEFGDTSGCRWRLDVSGKKRIPSLTAIDNDYRVKITAEDGCGIGFTSSEGTAQVLAQPDGKLTFEDANIGFVLDPKEGGGYAYAVGSEAEGEVLTVTATVAPPKLDYRVDYRAKLDGSTWCTVAYAGSGRVRYVLE